MKDKICADGENRTGLRELERYLNPGAILEFEKSLGL